MLFLHLWVTTDVSRVHFMRRSGASSPCFMPALNVVVAFLQQRFLRAMSLAALCMTL
jgi:hypothetical protein